MILWIAATAAVVAFSAMRWWPATDDSAAAASAFSPAFALADSEGSIRTTAEFRGKFLLVFFGFTSCPDVCPTTLAEVAQVMDDLGSDAGSVQPIFISIDPERDMRLGLADYTKAFHPAILGLVCGRKLQDFLRAGGRHLVAGWVHNGAQSWPLPDRSGWRVATSIHLRHTCGRHPF